MRIKQILFAGCLAAIACSLAACDDPKTARHALEAMGFTHIETHGYAMFGCSKSDDFATKFVAVNPQGRTVTGVVCSGWLKGATVRFD